MGYTFAYAQGYEVGQSLLEKDQVDNVLRYLKEAPEKGSRDHHRSGCCLG